MTTEPEEPTAPRLICEKLQIGHGADPLLPPLDMQVGPGDVWVLIGRNGSGKSTLLRTLLGELRPVSGVYNASEGSRLAHVPQRGSHDLCVPARARDMVESGVDRGWDFWRWGGRAESVSKALGDVGATELAGEPYGHLSEGQKQRVLMARAMASGPDVLLLDEPTSAMDPMAERKIYDLIERLREERSLSVIIASHSLAVLPAIATHMVYMDRDDQIVVSGEMASVLADPLFQARYGNVMANGESP